MAYGQRFGRYGWFSLSWPINDALKVIQGRGHCGFRIPDINFVLVSRSDYGSISHSLGAMDAEQFRHDKQARLVGLWRCRRRRRHKNQRTTALNITNWYPILHSTTVAFLIVTCYTEGYLHQASIRGGGRNWKHTTHCWFHIKLTAIVDSRPSIFQPVVTSTMEPYRIVNNRR